MCPHRKHNTEPLSRMDSNTNHLYLPNTNYPQSYPYLFYLRNNFHDRPSKHAHIHKYWAETQYCEKQVCKIPNK